MLAGCAVLTIIKQESASCVMEYGRHADATQPMSHMLPPTEILSSRLIIVHIIVLIIASTQSYMLRSLFAGAMNGFEWWTVFFLISWMAHGWAGCSLSMLLSRPNSLCQSSCKLTWKPCLAQTVLSSFTLSVSIWSSPPPPVSLFSLPTASPTSTFFFCYPPTSSIHVHVCFSPRCQWLDWF